MTVVCALLTFVAISLYFRSPKPDEMLEPISVDEINEVEEIAALKIRAGLTALEGAGVTVEMDDSNRSAKSGDNPNLYVIHDDDVLRVINELRAAGAEAISINGQRLIETSEIRCAGPTLSVNNVRSAAPFIISAIGDKVALENAIKMRGGVEQTLGVWGIRIEVKTSDNVYIPPFKGEHRLIHAHPIHEKIAASSK